MITETTTECLTAPRERPVEPHPCGVPKVVALAVADGHHAHLSWVASSTRTP